MAIREERNLRARHAQVIDGNKTAYLSPGLADLHKHCETANDLAVYLGLRNAIEHDKTLITVLTRSPGMMKTDVSISGHSHFIVPS